MDSQRNSVVINGVLIKADQGYINEQVENGGLISPDNDPQAFNGNNIMINTGPVTTHTVLVNLSP